MKSRVFIVEPARKMAVAAAAEWGEIVSLVELDESRPTMWSRDYVPFVLERLRAHGYTPFADRVLVAGPVVNLVMVTSALAVTYKTPVPALFYCGETGRYVERYLGCPPEVSARHLHLSTPATLKELA